MEEGQKAMANPSLASTSEIMLAIQNVQQQAEYIKRESDGQVGQGKFKYANLTSTWEAIKQLLKENGLVVYQTPTGGVNGSGGNLFKTTLYHLPSGQSVTETMPMVLTRQDPQALGAAITFYRRYMITSMLGLIPDDDNDAREQRLATLEQKKRIVGAVKETLGDKDTEWRPEQINTTIENIIGKHPSLIREDEADNAVDLIKSYKHDS
jgi:hypothetical protein